MSLDERARDYLGIPYRHQGRNPAIGIDCVGLLVLALGDDPATAIDPPAYSAEPHDGELEGYLSAAFGAPVADIQPGDIAAIRYGGPIRHIAIVGDGPHGLTLIHTARNIGRVVEHRLDERWRRRIGAVYRMGNL